MLGGDDASRYLLGVGELMVRTTIGPSGAWDNQRRKKSMSRGNLRALMPCMNRCHGGGFELARDLHERLIVQQKPSGVGVVKCRGYVDGGRGRRESCDYTLEYSASVTYSARHY